MKFVKVVFFLDICKVDIKGIANDIEGQYECEKELKVEIYNCDTTRINGHFFDDKIRFESLVVKDYKNNVYIYSPSAMHTKQTFARLYSEQFESSVFFKSSLESSLSEFSQKLRIKEIEFYHPMSANFFRNKALQQKEENEKKFFTLDFNAPVKTIVINSNNIGKIEFKSEVVKYSNSNLGKLLNIEVGNYVKLCFINSVHYEDILKYIREFDMFVNGFYLTGLKTYETYIVTENNVKLKMVHRFLGNVKDYGKFASTPIKLSFIDYLEKMYKNVNCHDSENLNLFIPLDIKIPTSMEDQFVYYYRYIDLFFGNREKNRGNIIRRTHKRIELFLKEYARLFNEVDINNLDDLREKICGLRNHYLHEGYYLYNNEYEVVEGIKKRIEKLDYEWLYKIINSFKLGTYIILYTEVLGLDIDEPTLKYCCNFI